jgi:hypothetical protein
MVDAFPLVDNCSHACTGMRSNREAVMNDHDRPATETTTSSPVWRALGAAGLAVGVLGIAVGLGGLVWLHTSSYSHAASRTDTSLAVSVAGTGVAQEFLHAPASWPSVPRAEDVFAGQASVPADDVPAPTF